MFVHISPEKFSQGCILALKDKWLLKCWDQVPISVAVYNA